MNADETTALTNINSESRYSFLMKVATVITVALGTFASDDKTEDDGYSEYSDNDSHEWV